MALTTNETTSLEMIDRPKLEKDLNLLLELYSIEEILFSLGKVIAQHPHFHLQWLPRQRKQKVTQTFADGELERMLSY